VANGGINNNNNSSSNSSNDDDNDNDDDDDNKNVLTCIEVDTHQAILESMKLRRTIPNEPHSLTMY